ncbi:MAG: type II toxin-antitoxin system VapC family toxin [Treponema sp.]|nr:type II toxin-antitoxin system VapC family toxin [Treponema sp.]
MNLLLDTHILVWFHTADSRLSSKAFDFIMNSNNEVFYSPLSIWESEIKNILHPDIFPFSGKRLDDLCRESGMTFLPLLSGQITLLNTLQYSKDAPRPHKDPFDRMLICQAKSEKMSFLTHDELIPYYREECIISV